ncbi:putative mitochondrial protein [Cucumis melo var. makuwa]|uniref:Mitochondrial protein n=1 Tax=Cucumis melo var. makuwa TaxID=1194695 RepID=A0A5A7VIS0_CUCMM|nr:putative mitochondrial protein [Cucumis melo var. makuwa]
MDKARSKRTPAATYLKMTKDTNGERVDTNLYRSIIGSLLYLTASRPDIAFAVGVCARYLADPHWAGCTDDRKSTSGGCFFLGNNVTACFSKKQNSVSLSTAEVEYIAAVVSAVFVFCHISRFSSLFRCILFPQRSQNGSVALGQEVTALLAMKLVNLGA